ncbi:hypothetical protein E3N88_14564 [Mikania micrantha]|uniref:Uncharacterized protein n=1 Tax=Mikania micrantha TaxID=192012 RepID=A0A5N6P1S6_9ASTR|nr:hypothetical protein E3N88_14564 [Mikania micrantha]
MDQKSEHVVKEEVHLETDCKIKGQMKKMEIELDEDAKEVKKGEKTGKGKKDKGGKKKVDAKYKDLDTLKLKLEKLDTKIEALTGKKVEIMRLIKEKVESHDEIVKEAIETNAAAAEVA